MRLAERRDGGREHCRYIDPDAQDCSGPPPRCRRRSTRTAGPPSEGRILGPGEAEGLKAMKRVSRRLRRTATMPSGLRLVVSDRGSERLRPRLLLPSRREDPTHPSPKVARRTLVVEQRPRSPAGAAPKRAFPPRDADAPRPSGGSRPRGASARSVPQQVGRDPHIASSPSDGSEGSYGSSAVN